MLRKTLVIQVVCTSCGHVEYRPHIEDELHRIETCPKCALRFIGYSKINRNPYDTTEVIPDMIGTSLGEIPVAGM